MGIFMGVATIIALQFDKGVTMKTYAVNGTACSVEATSTIRMPFEPKDWLKDMRTEVREAILGLRPQPVKGLYARYTSAEEGFFDVENILFYNIGPSVFRNLTTCFVAFERDFAPSDEPGMPHQ